MYFQWIMCIYKNVIAIGFRLPCLQIFAPIKWPPGFHCLIWKAGNLKDFVILNYILFLYLIYFSSLHTLFLWAHYDFQVFLPPTDQHLFLFIVDVSIGNFWNTQQLTLKIYREENQVLKSVFLFWVNLTAWKVWMILWIK